MYAPCPVADVALKVAYTASERDAEVLAAATTGVERLLRQCYGEQARLQGGDPVVRSYTNSFFLRYAATDCPTRHVLVKIRRHPKMRTLSEAIAAPAIHRRMREEFESLRVIFDLFDGRADGLKAVKPLGFLPALQAIVLEEYDGVTLRVALMRSAGPLARQTSGLARHAHNAGLWLRLLHDATTPTADTQSCVERHREEVEPLLQSLAEALPGATVDGLRARFATAAGDLRGVSPVLRSAEDFTTDNVLCGADEEVAIIDVKLRVAPAYRDLSLLIVHPDSYRHQFLTGGRYFRSAALRDYRRAILEGYFGDDRFDAAELDFYCARNLLEKWLMYERILLGHSGIKAKITSLAGKALRRYFRDRIEAYLPATGAAGVS